MTPHGDPKVVFGSGSKTWTPAAAGLNPDTAFHGPADSINKVFQEVVEFVPQNQEKSDFFWTYPFVPVSPAAPLSRGRC